MGQEDSGESSIIFRIERNEYDFNLSTFPLPDVDQGMARDRRKRLIVQEETREGKGGRLAKVLTITDKGEPRF